MFFMPRLSAAFPVGLPPGIRYSLFLPNRSLARRKRTVCAVCILFCSFFEERILQGVYLGNVFCVLPGVGVKDGIQTVFKDPAFFLVLLQFLPDEVQFGPSLGSHRVKVFPDDNLAVP